MDENLTPPGAGVGREEILRRFEQWLDQTLAASTPPQGVDAELLEQLTGEPSQAQALVDDYALWSALTALTQETKLQGRSFGRLADALTPLATATGKLDQTNATVEEVRLNQQQLIQELRQARLSAQQAQSARRGIYGVLIDLHDRIGRSVETMRSVREKAQARGAAKSWLGLFAAAGSRAQSQSAELLLSLEQGQELILERLEDALAGFGITEIECLGQPFDPALMRAVDMETRSDVADGQVMEVYRKGYMLDSELLRPAEVKVARRA